MIPLTAALRAAFEQGLRDDKCVFVQPKDGLNLLAVIEAAKAMRADCDEYWSGNCMAVFDAALAALDKEQT